MHEIELSGTHLIVRALSHVLPGTARSTRLGTTQVGASAMEKGLLVFVLLAVVGGVDEDKRQATHTSTHTFTHLRIDTRRQASSARRGLPQRMSLSRGDVRVNCSRRRDSYTHANGDADVVAEVGQVK